MYKDKENVDYITDSDIDNSKSHNYILYDKPFVELAFKIRKKAERVNKRKEFIKEEYPDGLHTVKHTVHAGWQVGYFEGQNALLEDLLDIINDCIRKYGCD